jgi:hypothetical protein
MRLAATPYDPLLAQLKKRATEWDRAQRRTSSIAVKIWIFVFPMTIVTGFGGAAVMMYAFATKLMSL